MSSRELCTRKLTTLAGISSPCQVSVPLGLPSVCLQGRNQVFLHRNLSVWPTSLFSVTHLRKDQSFTLQHCLTPNLTQGEQHWVSPITQGEQHWVSPITQGNIIGFSFFDFETGSGYIKLGIQRTQSPKHWFYRNGTPCPTRILLFCLTNDNGDHT